ncbi:probable serine/threonine-protein kinase At1g54610 [Rutidosis leptorrhynchoides]|uniref:probable serine/threonine-protein kinase At1g54610 n=1 Tax=Rutidosis leptorrhynchoides TaxID=125765 RepID=UPI003A99F2D7
MAHTLMDQVIRPKPEKLQSEYGASNGKCKWDGNQSKGFDQNPAKRHEHFRGNNEGRSPNPNYKVCAETVNNNNRSGPSPWQSNSPNDIIDELVAAGWPSWLAAVSGEAIKGWLPLRANTFKKLNKIEEGSCSVVYKARHIPTRKEVVLKKVRFDSSDSESAKVIAMEIAVLRLLDHPNVIKLEGIVTSRMSNSLYLVFDYMDHDLATFSSKLDTHLTEPQIKHYMHQLISGLKHCHTNGVLHRDIKGSDLLVDSNGVLKIADFGSASFFDLIPEHPVSYHVATFWYRAPELLLGSTEYGVSVDLWSAGCILAGLLAKRPILDGHTQAEQLQKIYAICGTPPDDYWERYKLPLKSSYKPSIQSNKCITETFRDFPPSSLSLLNILLSIDPAKRRSAASALTSAFLRDACQGNESQ